ncbi:diguanylate cyclase domain-containing protein [Leucobacter sp. Z1108]|uniref:sensor domain-containing protein n=1 Tax=Leucobacter sp. Z1108 TaxID=3439066 RepID=UPI003F2C2694
MQERRSLFEHAPVALCAVNLNGEILSHNPILTQWLGLSGARQPQTVVGRNLVEWLTPAGRLLYETRLMPALLERGSVREVVIEVRGREGQPTSVILNANLVEDSAHGRRVYVALIDAAARLAFERELVEARRAADVVRTQLSLLQEATSQLAVAEGLDDLGRTLTDVAGRAVQAAWTLVRVAEADGPTEGETERSWGSRPGNNPHFGTIEYPTAMVVCRTVDEIRSQIPEAADALLAAGVEALIITPILRARDGQSVVLGAIHSWFRRSRSLEADVLETLHALAVQAERVIEHLQLQDRVRHRALHDALTGLPNRMLFEERLESMLAGSRRARSTCAVLFIDLDGFKPINDQFGHRVGDEVLISVADRFRETCRAGETVARLGGDEFVVAVTHIDARDVGAFATRIRDSIRRPLEGEAAGAQLSASIGAVIWEPAGMCPTPSPGQLVAAADAAMYEAKHSGKDRIVERVWSPALSEN